MNKEMIKELTPIEEQLSQIAVDLRTERLFGEEGAWLLNKGTPAADLLLESTETERASILHKLCPELEILDVYEGERAILILK